MLPIVLAVSSSIFQPDTLLLPVFVIVPFSVNPDPQSLVTARATLPSPAGVVGVADAAGAAGSCTSTAVADVLASVAFIGALSASRNFICPVSPGVANSCVDTTFVVSPGAKVRLPDTAA